MNVDPATPPSAPVGSMYLVLPVPFRLTDGEVFVEAQAANGLDRWADHFERLVVAAPVIPEPLVHTLSGFAWRSLRSLQHHSRIEAQLLPWTYSPIVFFKQTRPIRALIGASIRQADHLQFAIGGLIGDWAALAALEAIRQKRRYAIHTDRVEHEVLLKTASSGGILRRLKVAVEAPLMKRYHRHIIERSSLGLWHGDDCFRAYAPWNAQSHLIHDIHTKSSDLIDDHALARKLEDVAANSTLKIVYAGRLDPMKAPLEWLTAIACARDLGANLQATWYGEGALLDDALRESARLHLDSIVRFPGFVADRATLLAHLRTAHILAFTHITPESPRNLIESLVSGTPIVGYFNRYAENLLEQRGGGTLVPIHDTQALGAAIAALASDRASLSRLTTEAARNGSRFTDQAVFAERSDLIRQYA